MITITIYGLDQFVVGKLSRDMTPAISELYEVDQDEINFIAPECMVFHKGVEQTSWNVLVRVNAPLKVKVLQDQLATLIMNMVVGPCIHVTVEFYYFSQDDTYKKINNSYPLYIEDENIVNLEHDDDCDHEDLEEGEGNDQIYTGDIFQDFSKKGK